MQQEQKLKLYRPSDDPNFTSAYVDKEEWRDEPLLHLYVHGGFEGTNTRFSFYFPPKEQYKKKFFHLVTPVQGSEDASQGLKGDEDSIGFAVSNGAYFVESNMGGDDSDFTMLYRSSAAVAEYSRSVATRLFGNHRPFGYIYGGSGGAFKTISCVEQTMDIWDGSVPFVIGSPMSIPNMFTVRVHAMRILRNKFPDIIDAIEPGGSGNMFETLNDEEKAALEEATRLGFPPRAWFSHNQIGDGALPVLLYAIDQMDPSYYEDFWTKPGYLGSDPNGSALRDRFRFETTVTSLHLPKESYHTEDMGVDEAWQTLAHRYEFMPVIQLKDTPKDASYIDGTKITFTSGSAKGISFPLEKLEGNKVTIGAAFGMGDIVAILNNVKEDDTLILDNSDYIAIQTYHRHQVPGDDYPAWNQFRDEKGDPIYPQRPIIIGPIIAYSGAGSVQSGKIHGKMIVVASLLDESAFPWQADWYRTKITEELCDKTDDNFRLWYNDNAMHGGDYDPERSLHIVSYQGALNQALLDVSSWVEEGIIPQPNTEYTIVNAQVEVPDRAIERKGIQPVVTLYADGKTKGIFSKGDIVCFEGQIEVPSQSGRITYAEFDFEGSAEYKDKGNIEYLDDEGSTAKITATHIFKNAGTYFPVLRVAANRTGDRDNIYTQVKNLARVRVIIN